MSKPSDTWQRAFAHAQLQRQLQQRHLASIEGEVNRLMQQREELLGRSVESDTTFPMATSSALRRYDRIQRELQKAAQLRQATLAQLSSAEARLQVVDERLREAQTWEDRISQGRSLEDMTSMRLISDLSSPAQEDS
jgi:hypothetical protein